MKRAWGGWLKIGAMGGLVLLLALGMVACEEDKQEVSSLPPGNGTIDSPYIIQPGLLYSGIPIDAAGTLFFAAENVPAGFNSLTTASAVDINLGVGGFDGFFGDDVGGSFTPASGNESYGALGDGMADLFFQIDGSRVFTSGATFDVSVLPAAAPPAAVSLSLAAATTINCGGFIAPASQCNNSGNPAPHIAEFDLGFATAPNAPLSFSLGGPAPNPAFFRTTDCSNCGSGSNVLFPENGTAATYGAGFCHKNLFTVGNPGTCSVNPITGYSAPVKVRIVNNWSTSQDLTLTFSSP